MFLDNLGNRIEVFCVKYVKTRSPDAVLRGGGRAHFHPYRDQFSSDCQTVWDGSLLECYKVINFFVWPSDVWKLRFWTIFKKVWQKWTLEVADLVKKIFKKFKKMMKIFFFIFVFIMFYWMYYVSQTWFNDPKTNFTPPI